MGRPAAPSRQGLARGSQTRIPQASGPASGREEKRTQAHGRVLPGEAHAKPGGMVRRESEHLLVPTRPGNSPRGDPAEGRRCRVTDPLLGNKARTPSLSTLST